MNAINHFTHGVYSMLFCAAILTSVVSAVAHAEIVNVVGWKKANDPFADHPASNFISGTADIDSHLGIKATLSATCTEDGRIHFIIGLANSNFDIESREIPHQSVHRESNFSWFEDLPDSVAVATWTSHEHSIVVHEKLDHFDMNVVSDGLTIENPRRISFLSSYAAHNFVGGNYLLLGISLNGEEEALRVPLRDATVVGLLSQCLVDENEYKKKVAAEQAAEETRLDHLCPSLMERRDHLRVCLEQCKFDDSVPRISWTYTRESFDRCTLQCNDNFPVAADEDAQADNCAQWLLQYAGKIPENGEPDKNATQGWSCKVGFAHVGIRCVKK